MGNNETLWPTNAIATAILGLCLTGCSGGGGASSADLFTSMLDIQTANPGKPLSALQCNVVNVSGSPRSGTIKTIRGDGTMLLSVSYNNVQPGGGTGDSVGNFSTATPITLVYCHFTVIPLPGEKEDAAKRAIRASLVLTDQNGNSVANAEAR
jgi:hypothetical protein